MQNMEKEIRKLNTSEVRARGNRDVDGYALVFNSLSEDLGGFKEQIVPEAIGDVIDRSDVFALFNHTPDKVLARSRYGKGSLLLTPDDKGLRYEFTAPKTDLGDTLLEFLTRGEHLGICNADVLDSKSIDQAWQGSISCLFHTNK